MLIQNGWNGRNDGEELTMTVKKGGKKWENEKEKRGWAVWGEYKVKKKRVINFDLGLSYCLGSVWNLNYNFIGDWPFR